MCWKSSRRSGEGSLAVKKKTAALGQAGEFYAPEETAAVCLISFGGRIGKSRWKKGWGEWQKKPFDRKRLRSRSVLVLVLLRQSGRVGGKSQGFGKRAL